VEECRHGLDYNSCAHCSAERWSTLKFAPYSLPESEQALGISAITPSGSWCIRLDSGLRLDNHSNEQIALPWLEIRCSTLADWAILLCKHAGIFIPEDQSVIKTHPDRKCWNCRQPVGFEYESLACRNCHYSTCEACGNCFSDFPGGRNVDTGKYIRPLKKHSGMSPKKRRVIVQGAQAVRRSLNEQCANYWELLYEREPGIGCGRLVVRLRGIKRAAPFS
jgi:hypothetical protein